MSLQNWRNQREQLQDHPRSFVQLHCCDGFGRSLLHVVGSHHQKPGCGCPNGCQCQRSEDANFCRFSWHAIPTHIPRRQFKQCSSMLKALNPPSKLCGLGSLAKGHAFLCRPAALRQDTKAWEELESLARRPFKACTIGVSCMSIGISSPSLQELAADLARFSFASQSLESRHIPGLHWNRIIERFFHHSSLWLVKEVHEMRMKS